MTDNQTNLDRPEKPICKPDSLPQAVKDIGRFCTWRYMPRENGTGYTKIPYNPCTGKMCRCTVKDDFASFATAKSYLSDYDGLGVGIFSNLAAIDIDHCVDDQRKLSPIAQDVVATINSYTEYSPSGRGIRILFMVPNGFLQEYDRDTYKSKYMIKRDDIGLEVYVAGITNRYVTVTGNALMQSRYLEVRDTQLLAVLDKYMLRSSGAKSDAVKPLRESETAPAGSSPLCSPSPFDLDLDPSPLPEPLPVSLSDDEILDKICNSAQGSKFRDLWNGNWRKYYNSQSGADLALAGMLAFWTGRDPDRMDELFSKSALGQRDKWRNRKDYRDWTINRAINGCTDTYTPDAADSSTFDTTPAVRLPDARNRAETAQGVQSTNQAQNRPEMQISDAKPGRGKAKKSLFKFKDDGCYMDLSMGTDIGQFTNSAIKTGFSNLDTCCEALYAGFYTIAAISSLGKTTFARQLADQIAAQGRDVIFFSLEQSRLDIVSKSIARMQAQSGVTGADFVSSHNLKLGKISRAEMQAWNKYRQTIAPHMHTVEGNFSVSYSDIKNCILEYIKENTTDPENPPQPVIILDYLQIVSPPENDRTHQTTKDTVDATVTALKRLSRKYNLTIIAICSVNRANYLTPIDFESLKESGNIEFTADVVWGLQLQCLTTDKTFTTDGDRDKTKKREIVKAEKARNPRNVTLTCLKNRFGVSSYECYFKYDCTRDLFTEDGYKLPINRSEGVKI